MHSSKRHRLTVIIYRDQKIINVVVIRFRNNSAYVQRQIDRIFRTN